MNINMEEVYKEGLKKRSEALNIAISSLKYNREPQVIAKLAETAEILHAIDNDIKLELESIDVMKESNETKEKLAEEIEELAQEKEQLLESTPVEE